MSDRVYEVLFIADPNLGEPEVDALTAHRPGLREKEGAKIQKVEKWGKKRLAYLIGKHREGSYVLLVVEAKADAGQGSRAPHPRHRRRGQVHDRARGRGAEARPSAARRARGGRREAEARRGRSRRGRTAAVRAVTPRRCRCELRWRRVRTVGRRAAAAAAAAAGADAARRAGRPGRQGRGQALLLPAAQGLQVLRGQDRLRRLQGREAPLRRSCPSGARSCRGGCSAPAPSTSAS